MTAETMNAETMNAETGDAGTAGLTWESVCPLERLLPERGVAALLVAGGEQVQVALFRLTDGKGSGPEGMGGGTDTVHAIGNIDPISGAAVLSRGIVGDRAGVPVVASPVYKQAFSLVSGECLDEPGIAVPVFPARVADGWLQVGLP